VTLADGIFVSAPAKVNLCLHVAERRADGYHDLESLVAFVVHGDEITLEHARELSLSAVGPFGAMLPPDNDNLALKAARLLADKVGRPPAVRITLRKNLPVASGLGGGSADAAAVLRGLASLWKLEIDRETLIGTAALLGADVPVCLDCAVAWIEGRGERITSLSPLPEMPLLLVNPAVPVSTAEVFSALGARSGLKFVCPRAPFCDLQALVAFLSSTTNDLEAPARKIAPAICDALEELRDMPEILIARMSGSGATCFGIFETNESARSAAALLKERHQEWWIVNTTIVPERIGVPRALQ